MCKITVLLIMHRRRSGQILNPTLKSTEIIERLCCILWIDLQLNSMKC